MAKVLKRAVKHPDPHTQMDLATARAILAEQARRRELDEPEFIKQLHPHQRNFFDDQARFKTALCGRRAGKTSVVYRGIAQRMGRYPETTHAYVGVTREVAKRLVWAPLRRLVAKYKLPIVMNKVELIAYHKNGSEFWILGADKEEDLEKARGPSYKTFAVDEAASYRASLEYLLEQAVMPALGDTRGQLWVTGTPGRVLGGYFYEITEGKQAHRWSQHRWTVLDNPYFENPAGFLAEERERMGWDESHPIFRREYMGEWVDTGEARVYPWDRARNHVQQLPALPDGEHYHYILALDFGVVDPTAFVVLAYSDHSPTTYIIEAWKRADLAPSQVADEVRLLQMRYSALSGLENGFDMIVGDTGGMGKAHQKEMATRYDIYVEPAEKSEKFALVDMMAGDILTGRLMTVGDAVAPLLSEWDLIAWKENKRAIQAGREGALLGTYDDRLYEDHCADAALYGWRWTQGYRWRERVVPPAVGSAEWAAQLERQLLEEDLGDTEGDWWERTF